MAAPLTTSRRSGYQLLCPCVTDQAAQRPTTTTGSCPSRRPARTSSSCPATARSPSCGTTPPSMSPTPSIRSPRPSTAPSSASTISKAIKSVAAAPAMSATGHSSPSSTSRTASSSRIRPQPDSIRNQGDRRRIAYAYTDTSSLLARLPLLLRRHLLRLQHARRQIRRKTPATSPSSPASLPQAITTRTDPANLIPAGETVYQGRAIPTSALKSGPASSRPRPYGARPSPFTSSRPRKPRTTTAIYRFCVLHSKATPHRLAASAWPSASHATLSALTRPTSTPCSRASSSIP